MQKIFLLCGVPGSGKTWVAMQLIHKFHYFENDDFIGRGDYGSELIKASRHSERPILATCPFAERELRDRLENSDIKVIPVFIVENAQLIKKRYEARDLKPIPSQHITRAINIKKRAEDWGAFNGTSEEVLKHLEGLDHAID